MPKNLNIYAACASSAQQFCIAVYELDYEDTTSILLQYDGRREYPWASITLNRNIEAICSTDEDNGYAALADEGNVYLTNDLGFESEKISGAGVHSDDAIGLGFCIDITLIDGDLYVVGDSMQCYQRMGPDKWKKVSFDDFTLESGVERIDFRAIGASGAKNIFIFAETSPSSIKTPKLDAARKVASEANDKDEYFRIGRLIREEERKRKKKPEGRCFHWDGETWDEFELDEHRPDCIFVEAPDRIWTGGTSSSELSHILEVNGENGFNVYGSSDLATRVYSITKFKDKFICAGSDGLFEYTPGVDDTQGEFRRIKPKLSKNHATPSPFKIQAVDDVMFYFDYNLGIYIWDGEDDWKQIKIPKGLLKEEV